MKYVLVNYNFNPSWILEYTDDYLIYDRSDDGNDWVGHLPPEKVIRTQNVGNVDYDKLSYIVDNYDNLPGVFLWGKTNLFKYISQEEFELVKDNKCFTPLLTKNHHVYEPVCRYVNGMYQEINNSWYLNSHSAKFKDYPDFAREFKLPNPEYLSFPPGGNFILTKEAVHRYPKESYDKMRSILPYTQLPGEAHMCERSYLTLWQQ